MELLWNSFVASCVALSFLSNRVAYSHDTAQEHGLQFWNLKDSNPKFRNRVPSAVVVPDATNALRMEGRRASKRMAQWNIFAKVNGFPFKSERAEEQEPPVQTTTTIRQTTRKRKNSKKPVAGQKSAKLQENTTETIAWDEGEKDLRETKNTVSKEQIEIVQESTTSPVAVDLHSQAITTATEEIRKTEPENRSTEETTTVTSYISQSTAAGTRETLPQVTSTKPRESSSVTFTLPRLDTTVAPNVTNISKCVDVDCSNYSTSYDIKVKPHRLKVVVGRSVKLECQVSTEDASRFRVLWFKKNETNDTRSELLEYDDWTLAIESTKLWHTGAYYCVLQPRNGCCFVEREGVGVLGVYEKPNYYKHLLYVAALCALLLCFCVATVVFNYKNVKKMDAEAESADDKETVWLL